MARRSERIYTKPCRLRSSYVYIGDGLNQLSAVEIKRGKRTHLAVVDVALLVLELLGQLCLRQLGTAFLLELLRHCRERVTKVSVPSSKLETKIARTSNRILDLGDLVEVLRVGQAERAHAEGVAGLLEVALEVFAANAGTGESVRRLKTEGQAGPQKRTGPGTRGRSRSRTCTRRRVHGACTTSTG